MVVVVLDEPDELEVLLDDELEPELDDEPEPDDELELDEPDEELLDEGDDSADWLSPNSMLDIAPITVSSPFGSITAISDSVSFINTVSTES